MENELQPKGQISKQSHTAVLRILADLEVGKKPHFTIHLYWSKICARQQHDLAEF